MTYLDYLLEAMERLRRTQAKLFVNPDDEVTVRVALAGVSGPLPLVIVSTLVPAGRMYWYNPPPEEFEWKSLHAPS